MANAAPEKKTLTVGVADENFEKVLFFNRYHLQKFDGGPILACFGLVVEGSNIGQYSLVLDPEMVKNHEERNLPYVDKLPEPEGFVPPKWNYLAQSSDFGIVDVMNCARINNLAEMSFYRITIHGLTLAKGNKTTLPGKAVLLLRSQLDIHRSFLKELHLLAKSDES